MPKIDVSRKQLKALKRIVAETLGDEGEDSLPAEIDKKLKGKSKDDLGKFLKDSGDKTIESRVKNGRLVLKRV